MDLDLTRTIGLGLTTAFVGSYTIYQQAVRHRSTPIKEGKKSNDEIEDDSISTESSESSNIDATDDGNSSLPPSELHSELHSERLAIVTGNDASPFPPAPPSPMTRQSEAARSPVSSSIFALTSDACDSSETEWEHGNHESSEENDAHSMGIIDASLYHELCLENEELRRKLADITCSQEQERDINSLMPATPNGTKWSTHSLLEEVTRLRMELSVCTQAYSTAQDQLFTTQQNLHGEQRKLQMIANVVLLNRGTSYHNTSMEELISAVKELNEYAHKAKHFEQKCQDLETAAIESTTKILDMREQLSSLKLAKVQEVTDLRKQLVAAEESHHHREVELQAKIHKLESRLVDTNMQFSSLPVHDELNYFRNQSPVREHNPSFEDLTQAVTAGAGVQYPRSPAASTPNKRRPSFVNSKKNSTPKPHGENPSDTAEFTATVPPPLILSSTLSAVLSNKTAHSGSSGSLLSDTPTFKRPLTPTSVSRPRSSNESKFKNASGNVPTTPPSHSRLNSRLTNYTNTSATKSVSTQEFLRMLNDPSGSNGGL